MPTQVIAREGRLLAMGDRKQQVIARDGRSAAMGDRLRLAIGSDAPVTGDLQRRSIGDPPNTVDSNIQPLNHNFPIF